MELAEVEVLVGELELRVDRLRALYDQYFMGIEKLEPTVPRKDVERRFQVLRKLQIRNTAVRFKFQTVLQRYNTYQTYWMRICRQIEEGTYRRDVIRANQRFGGVRRSVPPPRPAGEAPADEAAATEAPAAEAPATEPPGQPMHDLEPFLEEAHDADTIDVDLDLLTEDPFPKPPPSQRPTHGIAESKQKMRIAPVGSQLPPRFNASFPPGAVIGGERKVTIAPRPIAPESGDPMSALRRGPPLAPIGTAGAGGTLVPPRGPAIAPIGGGPMGTVAPPRAPSIGPIGGAPIGAPAPPRPAAIAPPLPSNAANPSRPRAASAPDLPPMRERAPSIPEAGLPRPRATSAPSLPPMRERAPSTPEAGLPRPRATSAPSFPPMRERAPSTPDVAPSRGGTGTGARGDLGEDRVRQLYSQYIETKRKQNESTASITYEGLASSLRASRERLKEKHAGKSVDFEVVVKDGKTILRPVVK